MTILTDKYTCICSMFMCVYCLSNSGFIRVQRLTVQSGISVCNKLVGQTQKTVNNPSRNSYDFSKELRKV